MTSSSTSPSALLDFLRASYPSAVPSSASETDLPALSHQVFPNTSYTDSEKVEISQWLTTSSRLATPDEDEAKHAERLGSLNIHLSTRTTLLGSKPSVADIALYYRLAPAVKSWSAEERTGEHGYHHIVRFIDLVQNAPFFSLSISDDNKVGIDLNDVKFVRKPLDPKEEKERKKKEKAAAAASGETVLTVGKGKGEDTSKSSKKEQAQDAAAKAEDKVKGAVTGESTQQPKKEKQPKPQKQPAKETPLSPCLIDLRVGHILKAENHPNADSLYVSTIACGDAPGTDNTSEYEGQVVRTVCSGLNGLVPLEEMQGRKIVAVCNLKPVTMRGIKSAAMVLAASPRLKEGEEDNHKGPVELVTPPADAKAGERVMFEGWTGEPEGVLNPKKKVWETLQPGFTTTTGLEVGFDMGAVPQLHGDEGAQKPVGKLVTTSGGPHYTIIPQSAISINAVQVSPSLITTNSTISINAVKASQKSNQNPAIMPIISREVIHPRFNIGGSNGGPTIKQVSIYTISIILGAIALVASLVAVVRCIKKRKAEK
ncbi:MAG: hypothetical protein LQ345_006209 [Seirophora villosa]|nr:MAG: hypothetical protein LQ345_006209 [Seirophora villosa]